MIDKERNDRNDVNQEIKSPWKIYISTFTEYDTILAGGGDGTLGHVLTAVLKKTMRSSGREEQMNAENPEFCKPKVTIGTLPVSVIFAQNV